MIKYLVFLMLTIQDFPRDDTVKFVEWSKVREASYGHGLVIDDVESYVPDDRFARAMRNKKDLGNWVHEQTHNVNAHFQGHMRRKTGRQYNSFYLLGGYAVSLPEPAITLKQVGAEIKDRGDNFDDYFQGRALAAWNKQPLYVLNEASASAAALVQQIDQAEYDAHRGRLAAEWVRYSQAVVQAVEKHDPKYDHLEELRAFINWHNKRLMFLIETHRQLTEPGKPTYRLY